MSPIDIVKVYAALQEAFPGRKVEILVDKRQDKIDALEFVLDSYHHVRLGIERILSAEEGYFNAWLIYEFTSLIGEKNDVS